MRSAALAVWVAALLAPASAACPGCGLSNRFGPAMLVVFGVFMAAPFVLFGLLARYIRRLNRGD